MSEFINIELELLQQMVLDANNRGHNGERVLAVRFVSAKSATERDSYFFRTDRGPITAAESWEDRLFFIG